MERQQRWERRTPQERTDVIVQMEALISAARGVQLEAIAAHDTVGSWRDDGAAHMTGWLVATLGIEHRTASDLVEVATKLTELPRVASVLGEGQTSWDQVKPICRFATPDTDEAVAAAVPGRSAAELRAIARRARTVSAGEAAEAKQRRSLRMWWDHHDNMLHLSGRLPHEQGAVVEHALERLAASAPKNPDSGFFDPYEWRMADAIIEMASMSLTADGDADRATINVVVDADTLFTGVGPTEIVNGPVVSTDTARRLICDGRIELVAQRQDGQPIGIGRASRRIPPWLTRAMRRRDQGCRFPGCGRTRWTNGHHIAQWVRDQGPTNLDNLITLCEYHHRIVHEGQWTLHGDPNGEVRFHRPDGTTYQPQPPRLQHDIRQRLLDPHLPTLIDTN